MSPRKLRAVTDETETPTITLSMEGGEVVVDLGMVEPHLALAMVTQAMVALATPQRLTVE